MHVDYEGNHSVLEEHKPPYELRGVQNGQTFVNRLKSNMFRLPWSKRAGPGEGQTRGVVEA